MITQTYDLNLIPGGQIVNVHVSQYDEGRTITFNLLNGTSPFSPPGGTTALIEGTKPDKKGFSLTTTLSGNTASFVTTKNICAVAGKTICEFRLKNGNRNIGTADFILDVERAGLADDTDTSTSELAPYIDGAQAAAREAAESAEDAIAYGLMSKSYAVGETGTRPGEDTDNAKHYAELAARCIPEGTDITFYINDNGHLIMVKSIDGGEPIESDLGKVVGEGGGSQDYVFNTIAEMEAAIAGGQVAEGGVMYVYEDIIDGDSTLY